MRVGDRRAHLPKNFQALGNTQILALTPHIQSQTLHKFHDEIRAAVLCDARAKKSRNILMVQRGKDFALKIKSAQHGIGIHPALEQLDCHAPLE